MILGRLYGFSFVAVGPIDHFAFFAKFILIMKNVIDISNKIKKVFNILPIIQQTP